MSQTRWHRLFASNDDDALNVLGSNYNVKGLRQLYLKVSLYLRQLGNNNSLHTCLYEGIQ